MVVSAPMVVLWKMVSAFIIVVQLDIQKSDRVSIFQLEKTGIMLLIIHIMMFMMVSVVVMGGTPHQIQKVLVVVKSEM